MKLRNSSAELLLATDPAANEVRLVVSVGGDEHNIYLTEAEAIAFHRSLGRALEELGELRTLYNNKKE